MSDPRYWIATHEPGFFTPKHVLSLPDAEHIHVTRHPDGTITATPMRSMTPGEYGAAFLVPAGMTAERGAWVDIEEPA